MASDGAVIVDGNNVMGARPDGWWRDRSGASRRLVAQVRRWSIATGRPAIVVFDRPASGLDDGEHGPVTVRYATRHGRDAADDRIVEILDDVGRPVEVVTSDRALADASRAKGATVTGAGTFLRALDDLG